MHGFDDLKMKARCSTIILKSSIQEQVEWKTEASRHIGREVG